LTNRDGVHFLMKRSTMNGHLNISEMSKMGVKEKRTNILCF